MGTIIVALVVTIVVTYFILSWIDNKTMKKVIDKDDRPSYILDMENELMQVDIALGNSMKALRDDISRVVARELPKVVATGKNNMYLALETNPDENYREYSVVKVTEAQYNLIKQHKGDEVWLRNNLFSKELGLYASIVFCSDNYNGVILAIRVGKV
jgi:hypothetical protein